MNKLTLAQAIYAAACVASRESDALLYGDDQSPEARAEAIRLYEVAQDVWAEAERNGLSKAEAKEAHEWVFGLGGDVWIDGGES